MQHYWERIEKPKNDDLIFVPITLFNFKIFQLWQNQKVNQESEIPTIQAQQENHLVKEEAIYQSPKGKDNPAKVLLSKR